MPAELLHQLQRKDSQKIKNTMRSTVHVYIVNAKFNLYDYYSLELNEYNCLYLYYFKLSPDL